MYAGLSSPPPAPVLVHAAHSAAPGRRRQARVDGDAAAADGDGQHGEVLGSPNWQAAHSASNADVGK